MDLLSVNFFEVDSVNTILSWTRCLMSPRISSKYGLGYVMVSSSVELGW